MASAPTLLLVSVDEYLNASYHPDMEYIDGVLLEFDSRPIFEELMRDYNELAGDE